MKKIFILFFTFFLFFSLGSFCLAGNNLVEVYMFYSEGCPHCKSMGEFLDGLEYKYSQVKVYKYELVYSPESRNLLNKMAQAYGAQTGYVPMVFVGDKVVVGDNEPAVESEVNQCISQGCKNPSERIDGEIPNETTTVENGTTPVELPSSNVNTDNDQIQIETNGTNPVVNKHQNTGYIILIITGLAVLAYVIYVAYKCKR